MSLLVERDVCRRGVSVDDPLRMGLLEAPGDLHGEPEPFVDGKGAAADPFFEGFALVAGHGEDHPSILRISDFEDGADVGMIQGGGGPGFLDKAPFLFLRLGPMRRETLEGNRAVKFGVLGPVNGAHAAGSKLIEDPEVGKGLADHRFGLRKQSAGTRRAVPDRPAVGVASC